MKIYPAIDLIDGKCVRLEKGDFAKKTIYNDSPIDMAKEFEQQGAKYLHIVDLDGTKAEGTKQTELIKKIVTTTSLNIQVGGGIRSQLEIENLLSVGVNKVVVGSLAVKNKSLMKSIIDKFGKDRITLALDVKISNEIPFIATTGWQNTSKETLFALMEYYKDNLPDILCTDISKDGMLQGPNLTLYKNILNEYPETNLQASGGVSSLEDLQDLKEANMDGVIIGKALYENAFSLKEALQC